MIIYIDIYLLYICGRLGIKFIALYQSWIEYKHVKTKLNIYGVWVPFLTSQWTIPVQTWILLVLLVFYSSNAPPMEQDWWIQTSWTYIWAWFAFSPPKAESDAFPGI